MAVRPWPRSERIMMMPAIQGAQVGAEKGERGDVAVDDGV
jgi:hypothetical protein